MEGMPSLNMPVQRLKVAILPLDLPCSGPVTHSEEILTTGKSHGKKPDIFSLNDNMNVYYTLDEIAFSVLKCSTTKRIDQEGDWGSMCWYDKVTAKIHRAIGRAMSW